jgi:hypothetical protein
VKKGSACFEGHGSTTTGSTLHQCFKYFKDGQERKVAGDLQPFSIFESTYSVSKDLKRTPSPMRTKDQLMILTLIRWR